MIYKLTCFVPADRCGVWKVRVFHTYTHLRFFAKTGDFIKVSVRQAKPFNRLRRKRKTKSFILRTRQWIHRPDYSIYCFFSNSGVLLKKRLKPRGKYVIGPISTYIKRRKLLNAFNFVLLC